MTTTTTVRKRTAKKATTKKVAAKKAPELQLVSVAGERAAAARDVVLKAEADTDLKTAEIIQLQSLWRELEPAWRARDRALVQTQATKLKPKQRPHLFAFWSALVMADKPAPMEVPTAPGIYVDLPFSVYIQIEAVNASSLKAMLISPKHYLHALTESRKDTASKRKGRGVHTLSIEPENFDRDYVVYDGDKQGNAWKFFQDAFPDWSTSAIVTAKERASWQLIADELRADPVTGALFTHPDIQREVTIIWECPVTGILCKSRLDMALIKREPRRGTYDIKTTVDNRNEKFGNKSFDLLYEFSAAFYTDAARAAWGEKWGKSLIPHRLITVENHGCHDVVVFSMPTTWLIYGRQQYIACLKRLRECVEQDRWPGQADGEILHLKCSPWRLRQLELTANGQPVTI